MALHKEQRINLTALQRVDTHISQIIDNASQVALYKFNQRTSEWEKTETEGTFFIFLRSIPPEYGFIVMNRLSTTNMTEIITADLEFHLQSPFLLYKKSTGQIFGLWFYDETECLRIEVVLNRLAQSQLQDNNKLKSHRQRCASEGDQKLKQNTKEKGKADRDILSLLSQAQEEYDKQQKIVHIPSLNSTTQPKKKEEKQVEKKTEIIKPTPVRLSNGQAASGCGSNKPSDAPLTPNLGGTSLNLATLFAQAKATEQGHISPIAQSKDLVFQTSNQPSNLNKPVDLQRLLSNPANTVEHIEKIQLNENTSSTNPARDRSTSCSSAMNLYTSAENLEKDLKKKLKLINLPTSNQNFNSAFNPSMSLPKDDVFLSNEVSRRHSTNPEKVPIVCPANMAPIVPASFIRTSPLVPISATNTSTATSDSFPQKPLIDDRNSPIITPALLEESMDSTFFEDKELVSSTFPTSLPSRSTGPLISPLIFTQPLSNFTSTPNLPALGPNVSKPFRVNGNEASMLDGDPKSGSLLALTKDHLKESLVYLLQNDDDFLSKVHEGYIASLKSQLTRFGTKS